MTDPSAIAVTQEAEELVRRFDATLSIELSPYLQKRLAEFFACIIAAEQRVSAPAGSVDDRAKSDRWFALGMETAARHIERQYPDAAAIIRARPPVVGLDAQRGEAGELLPEDCGAVSEDAIKHLAIRDQVNRAIYKAVRGYRMNNMTDDDDRWSAYPLVDLMSNPAPFDIGTGEIEMVGLADEIAAAVTPFIRTSPMASQAALFGPITGRSVIIGGANKDTCYHQWMQQPTTGNWTCMMCNSFRHREDDTRALPTARGQTDAGEGK